MKVITRGMSGKVRRMHYREHFSYSGIAQRTGLTRDTVRKWLKVSVKVKPEYRRGRKDRQSCRCITKCWSWHRRQMPTAPRTSVAHPRPCTSRSRRQGRSRARRSVAFCNQATTYGPIHDLADPRISIPISYRQKSEERPAASVAHSPLNARLCGRVQRSRGGSSASWCPSNCSHRVFPQRQ